MEATSHSVHLYGRDDVFGSLRLQETVLRCVRSGWRPLRAQRRGSEAPLLELSFEGLCLASPLHEKEFHVSFRSSRGFDPPLPKLAWLSSSVVQLPAGRVSKTLPLAASEAAPVVEDLGDSSSEESGAVTVTGGTSRSRAVLPPPPPPVNRVEARDIVLQRKRSANAALRDAHDQRRSVQFHSMLERRSASRSRGRS